LGPREVSVALTECLITCITYTLNALGEREVSLALTECLITCITYTLNALGEREVSLALTECPRLVVPQDVLAPDEDIVLGGIVNKRWVPERSRCAFPCEYCRSPLMMHTEWLVAA
jgi:hypothetical protein